MDKNLNVTIRVNKKTGDLNVVKTEIGDVTKSTLNASKGFDDLYTSISRVAKIGGTLYLLKQNIDMLKGGLDLANEVDILNTKLETATGGTYEFGSAISYLRTEADTYRQNLKVLESSYASYTASARETNLSLTDQRDIFSGIVTASAALKLSSDQTEGALRAVEQMLSKGNVQAEELRGQLGERLPGAFNLAAKAMGVSTDELNDMLDRGEVLAEDLLPKLADVLEDRFSEAAIKAARGIQGSYNIISNSMLDMQETLLNALENSGVTEWIADTTDALKSLTEDWRVSSTEVKNIVTLDDAVSKYEQLSKELEDLQNVYGIFDLFNKSVDDLGNWSITSKLDSQDKVKIRNLNGELKTLEKTILSLVDAQNTLDESNNKKGGKDTSSKVTKNIKDFITGIRDEIELLNASEYDQAFVKLEQKYDNDLKLYAKNTDAKKLIEAKYYKSLELLTSDVVKKFNEDEIKSAQEKRDKAFELSQAQIKWQQDVHDAEMDFIDIEKKWREEQFGELKQSLKYSIESGFQDALTGNLELLDTFKSFGAATANVFAQQAASSIVNMTNKFNTGGLIAGGVGLGITAISAVIDHFNSKAEAAAQAQEDYNNVLITHKDTLKSITSYYMSSISDLVGARYDLESAQAELGTTPYTLESWIEASQNLNLTTAEAIEEWDDLGESLQRVAEARERYREALLTNIEDQAIFEQFVNGLGDAITDEIKSALGEFESLSDTLRSIANSGQDTIDNLNLSSMDSKEQYRFYLNKYDNLKNQLMGYFDGSGQLLDGKEADLKNTYDSIKQISKTLQSAAANNIDINATALNSSLATELSGMQGLINLNADLLDGVMNMDNGTIAIVQKLDWLRDQLVNQATADTSTIDSSLLEIKNASDGAKDAVSLLGGNIDATTGAISGTGGLTSEVGELNQATIAQLTDIVREVTGVGTNTSDGATYTSSVVQKVQELNDALTGALSLSDFTFSDLSSTQNSQLIEKLKSVDGVNISTKADLEKWTELLSAINFDAASAVDGMSYEELSQTRDVLSALGSYSGSTQDAIKTQVGNTKETSKWVNTTSDKAVFTTWNDDIEVKDGYRAIDTLGNTYTAGAWINYSQYPIVKYQEYKDIYYSTKGFFDGGDTPNVGIHTPVWTLLHGDEWVAPNWMKKMYPEEIAYMEMLRLNKGKGKGYKDGGSTGGTIFQSTSKSKSKDDDPIKVLKDSRAVLRDMNKRIQTIETYIQKRDLIEFGGGL